MSNMFSAKETEPRMISKHHINIITSQYVNHTMLYTIYVSYIFMEPIYHNQGTTTWHSYYVLVFTSPDVHPPFRDG